MQAEQPVDSLDGFFSNCQELLFVADHGGAIVRMSTPLAGLLGPEVQQGTKLSDRVHPDDQAAFDAAWSRLGESGGPLRFRCRIQGANGVHRGFTCFVQRVAGSGEVHGSLRQSDLEVKAEILDALQTTVPMAVWTMDRRGIIGHHAGKALETIGLRQGQFVGANLFQLYPPEALEPARQALAGEFAHAIIEAHEGFWENWHIPVRDAEGEVTEVIGLTLDVSDAKRAEKALTDKLALIERQQRVINALSTPIIEVWDKVLTLPLVGVVDSVRTSAAMADLLTQVSAKGARFAILDLTGIEAVDTGTAAHLLKLIQALRLLGAEGIITGIQPNVAQTMVTLGLDLAHMVTLANLRDALKFCMTRMREGAA